MTGKNDDTTPTDEPIATTALFELAQAATVDGPAWSQTTEDLNVNLVVLRVGHAIAEHVNNEVDVLLVGVEGDGRVTVNGKSLEFGAGRLIVVPKGAARSITPVGERLAYVTCHRRRSGLWPSTAARSR